MAAWTLRPANADDAALLLRIFAAAREREMALTGWDAAQQDAFVRMQFGAQDRAYRQQFPRAQHAVVQVDGADVGRLLVDRGDAETCLVDIALLPEHRGRGLGSALLQSLLDEAAASGRRVSLHVANDNAAASLYRRLGFVAVEDCGMHTLMHWLPPDGLPSQPNVLPPASLPRTLETTP